MNLKLLIAACCLMAAVQARPQKPPSQSPCSLACVSRTFWTGYQAGNVYTYQFEQKVELSSDLSPSQASRMLVSGLAKVEVHSDCEMALTVEVKDAQVGEIDDADSLSPREPPAKVLEALRQPLRFAFENGRVVQLCPSAEETRASLNLKRGLLSQLQVSTEQRGQAQQLEERDILGDCWTEYTPEGPNTLLKTKDLSKCKLNYQAYPLTGVKSFEDERIQSRQPITKGSLKCRIEIDPERDIVKETTCTEEQVQSGDNGQGSVEERVRTSTRLSLQTEASGLASALQEVVKRTDLRHGHKTSSQCHSSSAWLEEDLFHSANECAERSHGGKTSAEYKAQAKKTLEELCEETKAQAMNRDAPKKYADLIKYLRGITEQEHFNELYTWVRDGYCSENPLLKTVLRSAIPTVGTKQSVSLILQLLSKDEVDAGSRGSWLIDGIALLQHPTPEILPELLNYVRKRRDDAMLGVTRDEPLALSAVVHKICQETPDCEAEPRVKAVIDYFSDSLGPACEQFSSDADNAFVALLSVGNMGRVAGGASALVRCAANPRLQTVHRAFALHSLRRFANLTADAQDQLAELLLNSDLDAELRIAAYQALTRHGFSETSRLHEAVRRLLDSASEDRQVQMFAYTHLQGLQGEAARLMAPVLSDAKAIRELEKLSRRQYSSSQRADYYSAALGAGVQAEVPIVFSAQSAIPRYVGLNLTVNVPSQGQSVNLLELGLRMQGLERLVEDMYNRIASKYGPSAAAKSGGRREDAAAAAPEQPELTPEQRRLEQTPLEPRVDLLVRRYGVEVSHTDLSGGMLDSIPDAAGKADYASLIKMLTPSAASGASADQLGASAGTLAEHTLALPTIAGLPILVKKEMHYITNLRISKDFRIASPSSADATLELQPAAVVLMSRTVAVDAIFERAGVQSSTSFLTSTGLRLSLQSNLADNADRRFSFKVEPLVKKQRIADAKTEVKFFQHTAGKVHVEKPIAPQQSSVKREKCTENFVKKYIGHKLCYETEYLPSCKKASFSQCPGSYQLFLEKSDDFGAYEVSFRLKNQDQIRQLQVLVGDQKSKDRLLKLNLQSVRMADRTNYKLELQNPVFPIILDSNVTKASEGYQVYSEMQAGSVKYVATGSVQSQPDDGIKVDAEIYPKGKSEQKVQLSLEHKFDGFAFLVLPKATTKLQAKMQSGSQMKLEYSLQHEMSNFVWQVSSQYTSPKGGISSMRYRVQCSSKFEVNQESSTAFLYDIEVQNPSGQNLAHSLHAKALRLMTADGRQTSVSVNHKLQYGADKKRSPMDFEARVSLKEASDSQLFKASGDGEFTYYKSGGDPVTAKLERLQVQIGEAGDVTDGFVKQYTYAVSYGIKFEETSASYEAELRHLSWKRWSWTQQAVGLKAKAQLGPKSYSAQLKHTLNGEKSQTWQIVKVEYDEYVYFHMDNKLKKEEGADTIKHELLVQDVYGNKVQFKCGIAWPEEGAVTTDTVVEVNAKKFLGYKQTLRYTALRYDHQVKHEMTLELPPSSYTLETDAKLGREAAKNFASFLSYQMRLFSGRYSAFNSMQLFVSFLSEFKLEQSSKLVGPAPTQTATLENVIDLSKEEDGVVWKNLLRLTTESRDALKYGLTIAKTSEDGNNRASWKLKRGLQVEVNVMDKSLKTEAEVELAAGGDMTNAKLTIASKDTWGWHDIKADTQVQKKVAATGDRLEAMAKLEGEISRTPVTSRVNITLGNNWLEHSKEAQYYMIASATTPESKTKINFQLTKASSKLSTSVSMDSNLWFVPFARLKAGSSFNLQDGISLETNAEIDGTKIAFAKVQIDGSTFIVDVKTAHPQFQEAGVKFLFEVENPETIKFSAIAKFIGLGKTLQIKKSGTVTLSFNSPVYSLLFGMAGSLEFEGMEFLIAYKKLQYDLLLKKKPGMEYQFVASVSSPDHSAAKQPILYLASTLNYWPFKAELKYRASNYQGWEAKYGVRAEVDYKSAFVGVEFKDQEVAATYEIVDQSESVVTASFRVKCSVCVDNGRDLLAGRANMTWPPRLSEFELGLDTQINSPMLQRITVRFVHKPAKKQILATFKWDGNTHKLIDCSYTQTDAEGQVQGDALMHADFRFFLGEMARAKVQASYQYGRDKEFSFALTLADSDKEMLKGRVFWLSTPRTFDDIPVASVDRGFQLKGLGLVAYAAHTSKTDKNCEWQVSISQPGWSGPITARLELADGKVKSGKIEAFGREAAVRSHPDGGVEVSWKSSGEDTKTFRAKWSGTYESRRDWKGKLEIEANSETNIFELKMQPQQIVFNYGNSASPNSLKIEYEASDIDSLSDANYDLTISHVTNAEKNSRLGLLPNYWFPVYVTNYPFKLVASAKAGVRQMTVNFESAGLGVKSLDYKHDFTSFPRSFSIGSNLIGAEGTKEIWKLKASVDRDAPTAEVQCQVGDAFKVSFMERKFQLQVKNAIDLTVQFPKGLYSTDDSDKKEIGIQLAMPSLYINEPISVKAKLQRLAEGRQLQVTYGRGDDDQMIMWSLTARKFSVNPKLSIDVEAALTSKFGLLGDWQIRSVEARLESSIETQVSGYTIAYKDSVKVNGDDWTSTIVRLYGTRDGLPSLPGKGEVTVTGKLECELKFDLGDQEKPTKVTFSVDKFGDSRKKYSLKLRISPMKTGDWCPDFKVETECPHRQFVIGKESKDTAGESRVALQLYVNKRQGHGATVVYKVESPVSDVPKYTIEVGLPTRKIRAVCQPEMAHKKFGIMTTFAWDAEKSPEKTIGLDARVDYSVDAVAVLECKAPFLRNRVRLEARHESKEAGYTAQLKYLNGDSEDLTVKAEYGYERQAQSDVARFSVETSGAVQSKISIRAQAQSSDGQVYSYWGNKFDGTLKIQAYSFDKTLKFVLRPMKEITVACDHGASLSVKYTGDRQLRQLVIFVSGNDKRAARLKLECSSPATKVTAKLDTGSGAFDFNSDLRLPNYRPAKVLLRASMGASGSEVHAAAYLGEMTVGQTPSAFDGAAAVPGHLSFFAAAVRLEGNKLKYRANWRPISAEKMDSAAAYLRDATSEFRTGYFIANIQESLSSRWTRGMAASNIDTMWLAEEIGNLAANDLDQLVRYFQQALADNEFYLSRIADFVAAAGRYATRGLAAVTDTAVSLKETVAELQIVETIANAAKQAWSTAAETIDWIAGQRVIETITEYADSVKNFADYWYAKAAEKANDFLNWLTAAASDPTTGRALQELLQQASDYLDALTPMFRLAKDAIAPLWERVRSVTEETLAWLKSIALTDLLPFAMNHVEDANTVKQWYEGLLIEMRTWYDSGATPQEREAYSRTAQLLSYICSEDAIEYWRNLATAIGRVAGGDFNGGLRHMLGASANRVTVWRPDCDSACQRGDAFAAVEGSLDSPVYIASLSPNSWRALWRAARAPRIALRRIRSKLVAGGLPNAYAVAATIGQWAQQGGASWDPAVRLLAVRHRTAVLAGDGHLVTFDGHALTHRRPCAYLVARDFLRGDFSVVQEYRKLPNGRQVRDRLLVRFGDIRVSVERDGSVKVNDKTEELPLKKATPAGKSVEASRRDDMLTVRFNGPLRDALLLRCSSVADSCVVSVHPLYQGRVHGLAGSNDGRPDNDIRSGDASEHVKFWTAGECLAEAGAASADAADASSGDDCDAWFRDSDSPLAACFDTVDPRPYRTICQRQRRESSDSDACKATRQYAQSCSAERVRVSVPAECSACRPDSDSKAGMVSDKETLNRRMQVVFLLEDSNCGRDAAGTRGSKIEQLAGLIDRLKAANPNLKAVNFGLAKFGGSAASADAALTSYPVGEGRFGSLAALSTALSHLRLSSGSEVDTESSRGQSSSLDVLRGIAELPAHYQWEPLAQKHLIVISCKPCAASSSWGYARQYREALKSVKDQVFVHVIEGKAGRAVRSGDADCSSELAMEPKNTAKGSVWRLDKFFTPSTDDSQQLLVRREFQSRLDSPQCQLCDCSSDSVMRQTRCRVVNCDGN